MNVQQAQFSLTYNGPTLDGHLISVDDYAPSILALARAVKTAHRLNAPKGDPVDLKIKATAGGSFIVDLVVQAPGVLESAIDTLLSRPIVATLNATALVGLLVGTIKGILWLNNRQNITSRKNSDGTTTLIDSNGDSITLDDAVIKAIQNVEVREALENAFKPVSNNGIDSIKLEAPSLKLDPVEVTNSDYGAFIVPDPQVEIFDPIEREVLLTLDSVVFSEGNKWRFSDGGVPFYAAIEDLGFLTRVESGEESFTANDVIKAKLRTQQSRTRKGKLKVENSVVEVLQHIHGSQQIPLPFIEESNSDE